MLKKCNNSKRVIYFRSSKCWRFVVHINTVKALRSPAGMARFFNLFEYFFKAPINFPQNMWKIKPD